MGGSLITRMQSSYIEGVTAQKQDAIALLVQRSFRELRVKVRVKHSWSSVHSVGAWVFPLNSSHELSHCVSAVVFSQRKANRENKTFLLISLRSGHRKIFLASTFLASQFFTKKRTIKEAEDVYSFYLRLFTFTVPYSIDVQPFSA